jgi:hypothetical protein
MHDVRVTADCHIPEVKAGQQTHISLAIVRVAVDGAGSPIIRVVSLNDLFGTEHALVVTRSPDEATAILHDWLRTVIRTNESSGAPHDGDETVTST